MQIHLLLGFITLHALLSHKFTNSRSPLLAWLLWLRREPDFPGQLNLSAPFHGVTRGIICRSWTVEDEPPVDKGDHRKGRGSANLCSNTKVSIGDQRLINPERRPLVFTHFSIPRIFSEWLDFPLVTALEIYCIENGNYFKLRGVLSFIDFFPMKCLHCKIPPVKQDILKTVIVGDNLIGQKFIINLGLSTGALVYITLAASADKVGVLQSILLREHRLDDPLGWKWNQKPPLPGVGFFFRLINAWTCVEVTLATLTRPPRSFGWNM